MGNEVYGNWTPIRTVFAPQELKVKYGSSKKYSTSRTKEWSSSMTLKMSAEFTFLGVGLSPEISGSMARAIVNECSTSLTANEEQEWTIHLSADYVGKLIW